MTSLAQDYLDRGEPRLTGHTTLDMLSQWAHDVLIGALRMPLSTAEDADVTAERFVFQVDVPSIVREMVERGQIDPTIPGEIAVIPAERTWVEFRALVGEDHYTLGGLFAIIEGKWRLITVARNQRSLPTISGCATLPEPPPWPRNHKICMLSHWFTNKTAHELDDAENSELKATILETIDCLFLLNIPRATQLVTAEWHPKKQRAREKMGRAPLVSLRNVNLLVGSPSPRYAREMSTEERERSEIGMRARHRVINHLRVYRKGRDAPHVALIPRHWRGDARRGLIIHQRIVKG